MNYLSRPLFDRLLVSSSGRYGTNQNNCNVIYVDFSRQPLNCECYQDYIRYIFEQMKDDMEEAFPEIGHREWSSMEQLLLATGARFVFVLDEWDSIFYESFMTERDKTRFLKFLKGMLKDQAYVDLAYMTGVLPIAKYSSGSELNMFDEYHFINDTTYDAYFGFCEDEVRELCQTHGGLTFEDLKQWYDGYHRSNGTSLFNPRSVNKALSRGICLNYWTETGPMNEIADCIEQNVSEVREDIVRMVSGVPVEAELDGYSAANLELETRNEILSAMVVYGFLDYYDGCLRIPNRELMEKFQKVLSRDSMGEVKAIVDQSKSMLEATLQMDQEKVAEILESVHDREIPFLKYHDENALSCVITLCYLYARKDYRIEREQKSGKGYCDYIFLPRKHGKPAIILELKVGKSAEDAIRQIKERECIQRAGVYREVLLVGINYDENKHHTCMIEKVYNCPAMTP